MPKSFKNSDELIKQMQLDELADAKKLTPREYAKLRSMTPQLVYYYIRTGRIKKESCDGCGRGGLIDVAIADQFFEERKKKNPEVSRSNLESS